MLARIALGLTNGTLRSMENFLAEPGTSLMMVNWLPWGCHVKRCTLETLSRPSRLLFRLNCHS